MLSPRFVLFPLLVKKIFQDFHLELENNQKSELKFLANFSKKSTFQIYIAMKKIIINENQLKKLIKNTAEKNTPVKPNKIKLTTIVKTHDNKNK